MTAPCSLAGLDVSQAKVRMPIVGAWHADVVLIADEAPTGRVTLDLFGVEFVGTITRSTVVGGKVRLRMVGGAGKLTQELQPKHWGSGAGLLTVGKVLLDALAAGYETLSPTSDQTALATSLTSWQRQLGPVSRAIQSAVDQVGATWRVLRDGTIWVGTDTFPETTTEHVFLDEDWDAGVIEIAPDIPDLVPGITFRDQTIKYVVHTVDAGRTMTEACLDSPSGLLDRFLTGVRQEIRYSRSYICKVVRQNSDYTLELMPYDATFQGKGLSRVPIRCGLPGVRVKVSKGCRVRVQWDDGNPSKPYANSWDFDETSVTEIEFKPGIGSPFFRVGDTGEAVLPAGTLLMTAIGPATLVAPSPLTFVAMSGGSPIVKG